ncbi:hypothetical protein Q7P35_000542 [Cladosporium inversicolor]
MSGIRDKLKRKLSMHDKNADFNEDHDENDVDEETTGHLHREIERAEAEGHYTGRPNSFLNRLISHGNDKTEKQLATEALLARQAEEAKQGQQTVKQ